jgi:hypothetical protein
MLWLNIKDVGRGDIACLFVCAMVREGKWEEVYGLIISKNLTGIGLDLDSLSLE